MVKKRHYQPPLAINLNGAIALGQQVSTRGSCESGLYPYTNCVSGDSFEASCNTGAAPDSSSCGGGYYHAKPTCRSGKDAATICGSGGYQQ